MFSEQKNLLTWISYNTEKPANEFIIISLQRTISHVTVILRPIYKKQFISSSVLRVVSM